MCWRWFSWQTGSGGPVRRRWPGRTGHPLCGTTGLEPGGPCMWPITRERTWPPLGPYSPLPASLGLEQMSDACSWDSLPPLAKGFFSEVCTKGGRDPGHLPSKGRPRCGPRCCCSLWPPRHVTGSACLSCSIFPGPR